MDKKITKETVKEVTTKDVKKKSVDDFEKDFIEYTTTRLLSYSDVDKETTTDMVYHALHVLWIFDIRDAISLMLNVEGLLFEFKKKFGDRYSMNCDCYQEKIDKGEIVENNNCEGC